jgi:predicted nucleic acid-binding protein
MPLVVDASVIVSSLTELTEAGDWARTTLLGERLASPHLMLFEVANTFSNQAKRGDISKDMAEDSLRRLLEMRISLSAFPLTARRTWELRDNFSIYDASYVALAELLDAPLVTLDKGIANGPRLRCDLLLFPG